MKKILIVVVTLLIVLGALFWGLRYFGVSCYGSCSVPTAHTDGQTIAFSVEPFVAGLEVPWSIAFTEPQRLLVTERPGRIRIIQNGKLIENPAKTFAETYAGSEAGLMGLTIDPEYAANKYVYVSLAYLKSKTPTVKIVRLTDEGETLTNDTVILDGIPAASNHAGNRIKFGPDGKLYISTGDATDGSLAQNRSSLAGKILRINKDGSIPTDNPFPNSPVYSLGHRNPQGLDWDSAAVEKTLWATEHGPSIFDGPAGGDEVNRIVAGKNYGWPTVSHNESKVGLEDPEAVFTPAVAPSGMSFYDGNVLPQFKNKLLFAGLKGQGIFVLTLTKDRTSIDTSEKLALPIDVGRVREIIEGPDGFIYFTSSNRDGRGSPKTDDDKIYRLMPKN